MRQFQNFFVVVNQPCYMYFLFFRGNELVGFDKNLRQLYAACNKQKPKNFSSGKGTIFRRLYGPGGLIKYNKKAAGKPAAFEVFRFCNYPFLRFGCGAGTVFGPSSIVGIRSTLVPFPSVPYVKMIRDSEIPFCSVR